eukprot:4189904-Pyramimonas_sp.AAC.1
MTTLKRKALQKVFSGIPWKTDHAQGCADTLEQRVRDVEWPDGVDDRAAQLESVWAASAAQDAKR